MLDSDAKIQKPGRTKQEFSWAIFSCPGDAAWKCVYGGEQNVVFGKEMEALAECVPSGFYFQPFLQGNSSFRIIGEAEIIDSKFLAKRTEVLLNESSILSQLNKFESTTIRNFQEEIEKIKSEINLGNLVKVVAARKKTQRLKPWTASVLSVILNELKIKYPNSLIFLLNSAQFGCWIGASPEQLLTITNSQANVMALAGTLTEQQKEWTVKEREEQSVTHDFIGNTLSELGYQAESSGLKEVNLGKVKHLLREWKFPLTFNNWFSVVRRLHPTPAVAGFPQQKSIEWLSANEILNRKLYAGWLGYVDSQTRKLDIYVALRCGELFQNAIVSYAGCGINLGSDFQTEWNETEVKMQTITDVFSEFLLN